MELTPYDLRTELRRMPRELDAARPRFDWRLRSRRDGDDQASFRLTVRADRTGAPVWDSGWVESRQVTTRYEGAALSSFESYTWELAVRSTSGSVGVERAAFETGAFARGDWVASWIARSNEWVGQLARPGVPFERSWVMQMAQPSLRVRREFTLPRAVIRARLFTTAHGVYRAYLNGDRIGDDELAPGWTDYRHRIQYQGYDVTAHLRSGANVIGMVVGEGWWSGCVGYDVRRHARQYGPRPHAFAQLVIDLDDGTRMHLGTDESWRESVGEIVYDDLLMGEAHDLTLADPAWCTAEAADVPSRAAVCASDDTSALIGQRDEPVGVVERLRGEVISHNAHRVLVDFGQNMVGRVRLSIAGAVPRVPVRVRHGEILDADGELYTDNLRSAEATDVVIPDSEVFEFEPWFTFHGFRYAEITGLPATAEIVEAEGVVLSSRTPLAGDVTTSSPLIEKLMSNIRWGQTGNFLSVPTDCPQRDERLGWTADAQVFFPTAAFNVDVQAFFDRWLLDVSDAQLPNGSVPDVVPVPPSAEIFDYGAPGWGDAATIIPWEMYRVYGDTDLLARHYASMTGWVDYVTSRNSTGLWDTGLGNNYGDWLSVDEETSRVLVATAYRARSLDLTAAAARVLGRDADADRYEALAEVVRDAFTREFVAGESLVDETQSSYVFALAWRLVPERLRGHFGRRLVTLLRGRGERITTGFLGVGLICPVLCEIGEESLAYDLVFQTAYPSWGYSIAQGATTIWERWDGWTHDRGFQAHTMNSFNHYSLGSVGEWIYRKVAGIDQTVDSIGFERLRVDPGFDPRLDHVDARYETPRGLVRVSWRRTDAGVDLELEVPPGATAVLGFVPGGAPVASGTHRFVIPGDLVPTPVRQAVAT